MLNFKLKLITAIISGSLCVGTGYAIHKVNINTGTDIEIPKEDSNSENNITTEGSDDNINSDLLSDTNNYDNFNEKDYENDNNENVINDGNIDDLKEIIIEDNKLHEEVNETKQDKNEQNDNKCTSSDNNISLKPNDEKPSQDNLQDINNKENNFLSQVEQLIFNKVNEERSKNAVASLSYSSTMEKYARIKSKDMGDKNYFDHADLNGNYITSKMKSDGVKYSAWAENIAYISGVTDANALADKFMTNWMNSSGHRKNILSNSYTSIGVGVYKVGNKVYATQEFIK